MKLPPSIILRVQYKLTFWGLGVAYCLMPPGPWALHAWYFVGLPKCTLLLGALSFAGSSPGYTLFYLKKMVFCSRPIIRYPV